MIPATGPISRMKLKLSFFVKVMLTVAAVVANRSVAIRGRAHDCLGGDSVGRAWRFSTTNC